MIVVDTNVLAYAVIPGERTEAALATARRDTEWMAPRLWRSELRNVLATAMRVQKMTLASALAAFAAAVEIVDDVEIEEAAEECLQLAHQAGISAYDAEFVLVAEQMGLRLVTTDLRLAKAFPRRVVLLEEFAAGNGR